MVKWKAARFASKWVSRHFVENVTSSTASLSRNVIWSTRHLVDPSLSRNVTWSTTSPGRPMYHIFAENVTSTTATLNRLLTSSTLQLVDTSLDRLTGDHMSLLEHSMAPAAQITR